VSSNLVALELGGGVTSMEGLLTFGIGNSNPSLSLNILDVAGLLVLLSNEDADWLINFTLRGLSLFKSQFEITLLGLSIPDNED
jgi:hypothetical protein